MNIVIFGANSAIAKASARIWAQQGHNLFIIGRDPAKLSSLENDLKLRTMGSVHKETADLIDATAHAGLFDTVKSKFRSIDLVFICHGDLGDQDAEEQLWGKALHTIHANFLSQASLATLAANDFTAQGHGQIAVITSVAGDRGRAKNYVYGSAKGGLSVFLSGLRQRLAPKNITVTDFRLGFVDTPMTEQFKKGPLWAKPEAIAPGIVSAISRKRDVVYLPKFWCLIMIIIRSIPEGIFKRLKI
jgi:decaprenylphospho-beta-D-erythro-pentofuranosid-2-ulose 2-reductase